MSYINHISLVQYHVSPCNQNVNVHNTIYYYTLVDTHMYHVYFGRNMLTASTILNKICINMIHISISAVLQTLVK